MSITQRNTPALFGDGQIDAITDDDIIVRAAEKRGGPRGRSRPRGAISKIKGRVARLADGRIGRFGWKLEFATLGDFVKAACANELGLSNPGRPQATPLGHPEYKAEGVDLTDEQCGLMADFIRGLAPPFEAIPRIRSSPTKPGPGRRSSRSIGCADCHSESLGPAKGLYSDLLLHDMGSGLEGKAGYAAGSRRSHRSMTTIRKILDSPRPASGGPRRSGASPTRRLTCTTAARPTSSRPSRLHGGEASGVTERFKALSASDKQSIISFLKTLRAPAVGGTRVRTCAAR